MDRIKLDTASFDFIEPQILRVRVNEGVDVDLSLAKQYCAAIDSITNSPTGLLVDKYYSYSLDADAQAEILSHLPNIVATAILCYRESTTIVAEFQKLFLETDAHHVNIFHVKNEAIRWLKEQLNNGT